MPRSSASTSADLRASDSRTLWIASPWRTAKRSSLRGGSVSARRQPQNLTMAEVVRAEQASRRVGVHKALKGCGPLCAPRPKKITAPSAGSNSFFFLSFFTHVSQVKLEKYLNFTFSP